MRIPGNIGRLPIEEQVAFAKEVGLDAVDLPRPDAAYKEALDAAGLSVGSVDVSHIGDTLVADDNVRAEAVKKVKEQLDAAAAIDAKTIFVCLHPSDRSAKRADTFAIFKETYPEIVGHAESLGLSLAMEPWPGGAPYFPTIGCTPEMLRAMFDVISSPALGICYDPSHFIRLDIDHKRVLEEFGDRVRHVHGKDTEILGEGRYLYGNLGTTFGVDIGWSDGDWRYTIPGSGETNWVKVIAHLRMKNYPGIISIELEDDVYGGSLEANKEGIRKALEHLRASS